MSKKNKIIAKGQAVKKSQKKKAKAGKGGGPTREHSEAVLEKVLSKRKPKTRKGTKIVRLRTEGQVIENAKTALVIRGNQASPVVMTLLRDIHRLRYPLSVIYSRRHDTHPFESVEPVEFMCKKFDHTLFVFGSSSKKRPFRVIFGRMFNQTLLDMQEYNITDFKSMSSFGCSANVEASQGFKPLMIFQGPSFETDERLKRTKSLLLDYFKGESPESVMLEGFEHVIVCTAGEPVNNGAILPAFGAAAAATPQPTQEIFQCPPVILRRYHIKYEKSGAKEPRVELTEIGPRFTLTVDRVREPDRERWKQSIKVPKQLQKKKVKNINVGEMGKKVGKFHLGKQTFDNIHTVHHGKSKDKKLRAELAARASKVVRKAQGDAAKGEN